MIPGDPMHPAERGERIATLWRLAGTDAVLSCLVYRLSNGFQLCVELPTVTIVRERFVLEPRVLARAEVLRRSLKRRGWRDAPDGPDGNLPLS